MQVCVDEAGRGEARQGGVDAGEGPGDEGTGRGGVQVGDELRGVGGDGVDAVAGERGHGGAVLLQQRGEDADLVQVSGGQGPVAEPAVDPAVEDAGARAGDGRRGGGDDGGAGPGGDRFGDGQVGVARECGEPGGLGLGESGVGAADPQHVPVVDAHVRVPALGQRHQGPRRHVVLGQGGAGQGEEATGLARAGQLGEVGRWHRITVPERAAADNGPPVPAVRWSGRSVTGPPGLLRR